MSSFAKRRGLRHIFFGPGIRICPPKAAPAPDRLWTVTAPGSAGAEVSSSGFGSPDYGTIRVCTTGQTDGSKSRTDAMNTPSKPIGHTAGSRGEQLQLKVPRPDEAQSIRRPMKLAEISPGERSTTRLFRCNPPRPASWPMPSAIVQASQMKHAESSRLPTPSNLQARQPSVA
jgi:hypothetical protein